MPASGRLQVAYDDIGYDGITQKIDNSTITYDVTKVKGSASVGLAVGFNATDDTVQLTADGDALAGKLQQVFDDVFCTVAYKGFVSLPTGNAAATTKGLGVVGALGPASARGYIRAPVATTGSYAQTAVDESRRARGRVWSNSDTTNVWIDLGA